MNLGARLVAAVIRLYPERFRARFGAEMLNAYLDQIEASSPRARWSRTAAAIANLLVALPGVRRDERRRRSVDVLHRKAAMERIVGELRLILRGLAKQPAFAVVTILTLALGIGANTAVFSVLDSVVLSPLPYDEPESLVRFYVASRREPTSKQYLTAPDIIDLRDEPGAFADVGALYTYREQGGDLAPAGTPPRRIRLMEVGAGYFPALRATPLLGRTFTADEEQGEPARIVLSYRLWHEVAGGDPSVIGRTLQVDGRAYDVVGVMRETFRDVGGDDVTAWTPANLAIDDTNNRINHYLSAIGRLAPGVSVAAAQARIDGMTTRNKALYPGDLGKDRIIRVVPLRDDVVGDSRGSLLTLMGAAGLVLLIACLNVANLFLARSLGQARDLAVRTAIGASRERLVVSRLLESVLVAGLGGLLGSLVAFWGVKALLALSPESLARAEEVGFDPRLLGFALVTTLVTGLLFGAWPAWRASRVDPTDALREGGRGNTGGRGSQRARDTLVAAQVAVALILLTGAGLLMRSFLAAQRGSLGFTAAGIETFEVNLPTARYDAPDARVRFQTDFMTRLAAIPAVEHAGATSWLPVSGPFHDWGLAYTATDGSPQYTSGQVRAVEGDYFAALGIPVLAGRAFTAADRADTSGVMIISRSLAKASFGDRDPLGEVVRTGGTGERTYRIIGIVGDVAQSADGAAGWQIYLTHRELAANRNWTLAYTLKTRGAPERTLPDVRAALEAIDPGLVLFKPRPMDAVVARHRARERFTVLLMGTFAGVALSLAAIGLYGVLSYAVTQRGHEIGVRMALGARPGQVRSSVLRHGMGIALIGMVAGSIGAMVLSRFVAATVFGASGMAPVVLVSVVGVLTAVVLVAGWLPARRATRIDPLEALRSD